MPARLRFIAFVVGLAVLPAATLAPAPVPAASASAFHLRLTRSEPADGATLAAAPSVIRLWFSLPPELAITAVKLTNASGKVIPMGAARRGSGDSGPVEVEVKQTLVPGMYKVAWKTSSRDGHPIKGEFVFAVRANAK